MSLNAADVLQQLRRQYRTFFSYCCPLQQSGRRRCASHRWARWAILRQRRHDSSLRVAEVQARSVDAGGSATTRARIWERCCCWGRVSGGGGVGFWRRATPHHVCALIAGKYTSGRSKSRFGEATGMAAPGARGAAARRSAGNGGLYVVSAVCSCCRCEQQPHHHASINNTSPPLLAWLLPSPPPPPSRNRRGKPTAPAPVAA